MTTTYIRYQPTSQEPFKFRARLKGEDFFCTVLWNFYSQRIYLRVDDASGRTRQFRPVISSPLTQDINLVLALRPGKIVYREALRQFEVTG